MKLKPRTLETYLISINALLNAGASIADSAKASNKPIDELINIEAKWQDFSSSIQAIRFQIHQCEDEYYRKIEDVNKTKNKNDLILMFILN